MGSTMRGIGTYVVTGVLALLAAVAMAHGEPGAAEMHFVQAATDASSFIPVDWLQPAGP